MDNDLLHSSQCVCVFLGSSEGARPGYLQQAADLGRSIAAHGWGLVYGGAAIGLMGALADSALANGAEVIGVIPESLAAREIAHTGLTQLHTVANMHERKALMASLSNAFIALPGGYGTLDEFLEILTWAQLDIHRKPCVLVNTNGYYDKLLQFLDHTVEEGFLRSRNRNLLLVAQTADEAMSFIGAAHSLQETLQPIVKP